MPGTMEDRPLRVLNIDCFSPPQATFCTWRAGRLTRPRYRAGCSIKSTLRVPERSLPELSMLRTPGTVPQYLPTNLLSECGECWRPTASIVAWRRFLQQSVCQRGRDTASGAHLCKLCRLRATLPFISSDGAELKLAAASLNRPSWIRPSTLVAHAHRPTTTLRILRLAAVKRESLSTAVAGCKLARTRMGTPSCLLVG